MKTKNHGIRTASVFMFLAVLLFSLGISPGTPSSFAASPALEAKKVVESSRLTLEGFMFDEITK